MKKGQVTLFVVIAIVLVAAVAVVFSVSKGSDETSAEIKSVKDFIHLCAYETAQDAVVFIGRQGGYFSPPSLSLESVPYYLYDKKLIMPSKQQIETEISVYMDEMLPSCIRSFEDFEYFDIDSNPSLIQTKTNILKDKVNIDIYWPLSVKKGDSTYYIKNFPIEMNSRLLTIYDVTKNITTEQMKNPNTICLSCLTTLAIQNDLYIDTINYKNDTIIFMITDGEVDVNNEPYEWIFVNKL